MNDYDPVTLVKEATTFARSRFGRHQLGKQRARVEECKQSAIDLRLSRDERADWGIRADEAQRTLDYYVTAQQTAQNPDLLHRLAEGFRKRMKRQEESDV